MGRRTMPTECPHGRVLDWSNFGPDPDDGTVGAEECEHCDAMAVRLGPWIWVHVPDRPDLDFRLTEAEALALARALEAAASPGAAPVMRTERAYP